MELKHKLLDHPFYQAWEKGEITKDQLSKYAYSYLELIEQIPVFWKNIVTSFQIEDDISSAVVAEETEHIDMWKKWIVALPKPEEYPSMANVIRELSNMNPSELLGAVHSFEMQQPKVAETKKAGLIEHYGFTNESLEYFDAHMAEDEHIAFGMALERTSANKDDFKNGFERGSKLVYDSLDMFMN